MKFTSAMKRARRTETLEVFCKCRSRHKIEQSKNIPGGTLRVAHELSQMLIQYLLYYQWEALTVSQSLGLS